jgi:hypothetical protein
MANSNEVLALTKKGKTSCTYQASSVKRLRALKGQNHFFSLQGQITSYLLKTKFRRKEGRKKKRRNSIA